mmetsp:Transcript_55776/g.104624  ORF Transcript_55776/g.104624 Transcript_55776/m.104624 type:complete len:242 (-) Transcript_55776:848-1573(-)
MSAQLPARSESVSRPRMYFRLQPGSKLGPKGIFHVQKKGSMLSEVNAETCSFRKARKMLDSLHAYLAVWNVPAENSVTATNPFPKRNRKREEASFAHQCSFLCTSARGAEQLYAPPFTVRPSQAPLLHATYQCTSATAHVALSFSEKVARNHGTAECSNASKAVSIKFTYSLTPSSGSDDIRKSFAAEDNQSSTSFSSAKCVHALVCAGSFMIVMPLIPFFASGSSASAQRIKACTTHRPV